MRPADFDFVAQLLKQRSGLIVGQDKMYLLESRLMPVVRKRSLKDLDNLVEHLRKRDEALTREVVEAMTTNESFFFRDMKPFDLFRDHVMPALLQARASRKMIRVWCAACSSGQEPYSLAILLREMQTRVAGWRIEIVGTDISNEILAKAKAGLYSQFEVQRGMPITLLVKYFQKRGDTWQISPEIRSMVQFRQFNLLESMAALGQFDVVFCRNVLIYFDQPTKATVLANVARQMPEDGFLFLGGAETVLGVTDRFKPVSGQRGIYCRA